VVMKILVVDNDPDALKVVKDLAESLGYEAVALNSSLKAAELINLQKLDGAFINASTPYMDGFVLVRLLRYSTSNTAVPIVMLSEFGDAQAMRKAFEAGVTFFLSKPIDTKKLRALLNGMRGQMLKDKRTYVRLPVRTIVNCSAMTTQFKSLSVNVSRRGILLETSGGLDVGQQAALQFTLPDIEGHLTPGAIVVRKEPSDRIAAEFKVLGPQDNRALENFITGVVKG